MLKLEIKLYIEIFLTLSRCGQSHKMDTSDLEEFGILRLAFELR